MKLIFAVVHDDDTNKAVRHLNEKKFRVTRLSSTGGFLRRGNTTLMLGVEDEQVEEVFEILQEECAKRKTGGSNDTISAGRPVYDQLFLYPDYR